MGYEILAIAVIVLVYVILCVLAVVYLAVPAGLVVASAGLVAGVIVTLAYTAFVLIGRGPARVSRPADAIANRSGGRRPRAPMKADNAWPEYRVQQAFNDIVAATMQTGRLAISLWTRTWDIIMNERYLPRLLVFALWPALLVLVVGLVGFSAGAAMALVSTALVGTLVVYTLSGLALLARVAITVRDNQVRRRAQPGTICPSCFYVTHFPAYACPGGHNDTTDSLHLDLRPGRLGTLWRRCGCGGRLPTGLVRASDSLRAHCAMCQSPLLSGAAIIRESQIPLFGPIGAGKTNLAQAGAAALVKEAGRRGAHVTEQNITARARTRQSARPGSDLDVAVTTLRLGSSRGDPIVHVFDPPGAALAQPAEHDRYNFFAMARALVFVIDPLKLYGVSERLGIPAPKRDEVNTLDIVESAYVSTVNRVRLHGNRRRRQCLAVVVTRADVLRSLAPKDRVDGESVLLRGWLSRHGLDNLVTAADRDFASVRYFLCAASHSSGPDVLAPFEWALSLDGIHLSAEGDDA